MSYKLPCDCPSRFIRWGINGPECNKCGVTAVEESPKASRYSQLDVDYACPVTGRPIRSKRAHEENLRIHGCHVLEKGEMDDAMRNRAAIDAALESKLDSTVEEVVATLPPDKLKQLETEALASDLQVIKG